jgi:hypothetical protein
MLQKQAHTPPRWDSPSDTPNTQRRAQINYAILNNQGFDSPTPGSPIPARPTKRARIPVAKPLIQALQALQSQESQSQATQEIINDDEEEDKERKKIGWF